MTFSEQLRSYLSILPNLSSVDCCWVRGWIGALLLRYADRVRGGVGVLLLRYANIDPGHSLFVGRKDITTQRPVFQHTR